MTLIKRYLLRGGYGMKVLILIPGAISAYGIEQGNRPLQQVLDEAPANAIIVCDSARQQVISTPVILKKPVTLKGLNATLPDGLGKQNLLQVASEGVTLLDMKLRGNKDSVPQDKRCALVHIYRGNFRVERCTFENGTKDGLMISPLKPGENIIGGVVRDIVGHGMIRDVVSISGDGKKGGRVRDILVENIKGYDSDLRGPVEVSDGSENITVRNVYAENCVYGIDLQDHKLKLQINRNVTVTGLHAVNCQYAIRNANHPFGHDNITIADVTAERCEQPIQLKNTSNYTLKNVRIVNQKKTGSSAILVLNCRGVKIEKITIEGGDADGAGLLIEDSSEVQVDGVEINKGRYTHGIKVFVSSGDHSQLIVSNVTATDVSEAGILLEKGKGGSLSAYTITGNRATVVDRIKGQYRSINGNKPD